MSQTAPKFRQVLSRNIFGGLFRCYGVYPCLILEVLVVWFVFTGAQCQSSQIIFLAGGKVVQGWQGAEGYLPALGIQNPVQNMKKNCRRHREQSNPKETSLAKNVKIIQKPNCFKGWSLHSFSVCSPSLLPPKSHYKQHLCQMRPGWQVSKHIPAALGTGVSLGNSPVPVSLQRNSCSHL